MKNHCLIFLLLLTSCRHAPPQRLAKQVFFRMNTVVEVTAATHGSKDDIGTAWKRIDAFLIDWEERFSQSHPRSEILALNRDTCLTRAVSHDCSTMLHTALRMGDSCSGLFDITVYPLKMLWGLGEGDTESAHRSPTATEIRNALTHVNFRAVHADTISNTIRYDDRAAVIDAGGIAKGFALMRIASLLDSMGYASYLINGGGDVIGKGRKPDGKAWRIGIKHPRLPGCMLGVFLLDSGAVFTSGDYERFRFDSSGARIHHIFNPSTGRSATANQSVTLWSMDPVSCKFYSTGLFNLPADSICAFVERRPWLECLCVDSAGSVHISRGWKKRIDLLDNGSSHSSFAAHY